MTLPTDLSLMDFLLEREDPLLGLMDKDLNGVNGKNDYNDSGDINSDNWTSNADDILDSMLKFEDQSLGILNDDILPDLSMATSSGSDSGMSSDQQLSPRLIEPDDEDMNILNFEDCPDNIQNEVEIDSSVLGCVDSDSSSHIELNSQGVINVVSLPKRIDGTTSTSSHAVAGATVLRVTPVTGNPRSLLLPVNLKNVRDIKTIKVINLARATKVDGSITLQTEIPSVKNEMPSEPTCDNVKSQYPRLQLTNEEKKLLQKEGVRLPTHYPLTKHEERELKRIRRKIRNKISAQDSRKRKKEYIDGLEERVKQCTEENLQLVKRIKALQTQNQSLSTQLRRLQGLLARGTTKSVQPATCLMVLLLSMALIMAPNLRPGSGSPSDITDIDQPQSQEDEKVSPVAAGRSRSLLFSPASSGEESAGKDDVEGLLHPLLDDHDYGPPAAKYARMIAEWPSQSVQMNNRVETDQESKVDTYVQEMRINISDTGGPRTVTLQVPAEK